VEPVTRYVTVRAELPNLERLLRPGMLLGVRLYQAARQAIVVPEIAVLQVGTDAFIYRVSQDQTAARVGSSSAGAGAARSRSSPGSRMATRS
jgi:membrane fusion protein (multidrug efflux system)